MWNFTSAKQKSNTFCASLTDPSVSIPSATSSPITENNISFAKLSICLAMDDKGKSLFATCKMKATPEI